VTSTAEICDICGQPKSSGMTGSFTQWVNSCRCEIVEKVKAQIPICALCGKQIDKGNTGSFTQWVLQQNCSCENPIPLDAGDKTAHGHVPKPDAFEPPAPQPGPRKTSEIADLDFVNFPIERYKPLSRLGMGGGGTVYLCFDKHLRKNVAVKIIRARSPEEIANFQSEAKVTAKFKHPNIISIIDFGITDGGSPFMVLEFVDGQSLDKLIEKHGALPEKLATSLFVQIAGALEKGHDSGIFHRDIKSSNIIVKENKDGDAIAQIIDFGIALMSEHEETNFNGKTVIGTPKYMSPDQLQGKAFDARSEMYSVGCVMYEALTGRLPFIANDAMTLLHMHVKERPPTFAQANPNADVSRSLETIVMRCLEKNPDARFRSMKELKAQLTKSHADEIHHSSAMPSLSMAEIIPEPAKAAPAANEPPRVKMLQEFQEPAPLPPKKSVDATAALVIGSVIVVGVALIGTAAIILNQESPEQAVRTNSYMTPVEKEKAELEKRRAKLNAIEDYHEDAADHDTVMSFAHFNNPSDLHLEADAHSKNHHHKNAEAACSRALEIDANDAIAYRLRGMARMNQGRMAEAKKDFDKAIELNAGSSNLRARALYYMNCGKTEKAYTDIDAATKADPGEIDNFIVLAIVLCQADDPTMEQLEKADRALVRALRLDDENAEAYGVRTIVAQQMSKYDNSKSKDAAKYAEDALRFGANRPIVNYCVGWWKFETNDYESAKTYLTKAIKHGPAIWQAYACRAENWARLSEMKKVTIEGQEISPTECVTLALNDFDKALILNRSNPKLFYTMAQYHGKLGKVDRQLNLMDNCVRLDPENPIYLQARGEVLMEKNKAELALADFNKSIQLGNNSPKVYRDKGSALASLGNQKEASAAIEQALKLDESQGSPK